MRNRKERHNYEKRHTLQTGRHITSTSKNICISQMMCRVHSQKELYAVIMQCLEPAATCERNKRNVEQKRLERKTGKAQFSNISITSSDYSCQFIAPSVTPGQNPRCVVNSKQIQALGELKLHINPSTLLIYS